MEKIIRESLEDVTLAMTRLNGHFEDKIKEFRAQVRDEKEIAELIKGAMAMKDAAGIYLAWSGHYIERLEKTEALDLSDELEGIGGP
jgi:RNA binding exosome subunit